MLRLPLKNGTVENYKLVGTPLTPQTPSISFNRIAFAAAHVVASPLFEVNPWQLGGSLDWDETLKYRRYLWDQGLNVAEAMDTAQRGMGLDWETAKELIERTVNEARHHPLKPRVVCGAGTDQFGIEDFKNEDQIINAYSEQMETIEKIGGQCVILASRAMMVVSRGPESFLRVYNRLIEQAEKPVILHWLGAMFDPALRGYWGTESISEAADIVLALIKANSSKVDGIKISLLDKKHEEKFRARLSDNIKLYTGDDFNYTDLIEGDGKKHSDALLGIFTVIAPAVSLALEALARGKIEKYRNILEPTVPLSREIFKKPTQYYKAGITFLAWLNGMQSHFSMLGGMQSSRELNHYAEIFRLADKSNLLAQPDISVSRMKSLLSVYGVEQN